MTFDRQRSVPIVVAVGTAFLIWGTAHQDAHASKWLVKKPVTVSPQSVQVTEDMAENHREQQNAYTKWHAGAAHSSDFKFDFEAVTEFQLFNNFDLDQNVRDDLAILQPEFNLSITYEPVEWFESHLSLGLVREFALQEEGDGEKREVSLNVDEAYIGFDEFFGGFGLRLGEFSDERRIFRTSASGFTIQIWMRFSCSSSARL